MTSIDDRNPEGASPNPHHIPRPVCWQRRCALHIIQSQLLVRLICSGLHVKTSVPVLNEIHSRRQSTGPYLGNNAHKESLFLAACKPANGIARGHAFCKPLQ